jgi:hypothetical protein
MIGRAVGRLAGNMEASAYVLRLLLVDEKSTVRLGAARANLELGVKLHESVQLEERIAALERASGQGTDNAVQPPPGIQLGSGLPATDEGLGAAYEELTDDEDDDGEPQEPPGEAGTSGPHEDLPR